MLNKKITVGIIFGGRSGEHEVSLVSAQSVAKALDKKKYELKLIGISKEGRWMVGDTALELLKSGQHLAGKFFLPADPQDNAIINITDKKISSTPVDVIFPVMHGTYGEDGTIQGLLELANVPYVGAGVLGSAVGMDKIIQKNLYANAGLNQTKYFWFLSSGWFLKKNQIIDLIEKKLKYPMFIKPANLGSSVGISKAHNQKELISGIDDAATYDRKVLVEESVENAREIECSVLGNDQPKASVAGEVLSSNEFYDYDAKYIDGQSQLVIPAVLPDEIIKQVKIMAINAFKALDLCGMARVDFLVVKKDNKIYINEVNTIPGFTSISMYPKLWEASGLSYSQLLDKLIELALERHAQKNKLNHSYKPKIDWHKN